MISAALLGLTDATAAVFARASWQRCRTHSMTSLLTRVRGGSSPGGSDAADAHRAPAAVTGRVARGACACRRSAERPARRCRPGAGREAGVDCWKRCGPPTPGSGRTERSGGGPAWRASSPAGRRYAGSLVPYWPGSTTSGRSSLPEARFTLERPGATGGVTDPPGGRLRNIIRMTHRCTSFRDRS